LAVLWKNRVLYIMLLPLVAWYIIFKYVPMYGVIISFKEYNIMSGIGGSDWANPWYKYFEMFFKSPYFTQLLTNTLLISCYKLIFSTIPPIILAVLLNESRGVHLKRWVQTLSYMPHFLSWVIVYGIAVAFFSETNGLVNRWISDLGYDAISFLNAPEWFRAMLVGTDIWKDLGWGAIIYIAAIAGIDPSLYEAAMMDGAGRLRRIWSITLPGIANVIVLLLILRLGYILDAGFDQVFIFYNIRVYSVGDIIDTWVYRTGLEQLNFSLAAAVGLFKSVIGMALVLAANKIARRWGGGIW
jgi:putative aldouronate transport system permease protein